MGGTTDRLRAVAAAAVAGTLLLALVAAGCSRAPAGTPRAAADCGPAWLTGWTAAQQPVPGDQLAGRTLRLRIRSEVAGALVRLRLSNRYGSGPLTLGRMSVARAVDDVRSGVPEPVPFGGRPDVTIPPGADALSDPVPMPGTELTVSLYLTGVPRRIGSHPVAMRTARLSAPGDATGVADGSGFPTTLESWPVLRGLDVYADRPAAAVVVVGDSLVDGVGGTLDGADRMTDDLAARLRAAGGDRTMTVLNAGLARNRLLATGPEDGGDAPVTRFDADVAAAAGARDVLLQVGTNDIAAGAGAGEIVDGLARFAARARASGLRVLLSTIPPSVVGERGTARGRAVRDEVNAWIRAQGGPRPPGPAPAPAAPTAGPAPPGPAPVGPVPPGPVGVRVDGVVDLAAAVGDPSDPGRLRPDLDSGDGLHPSPAGYRALAAAVDPGVLSGSPCLAEPAPSG